MEIRREVVLAYRRYQAARQSVDVLQSGVLKPNQDSSQIVQLAYRLGELRLLDVINQERMVIDAESSYIDAQNECDRALADLLLAIGK
jgi:cobalt-zinc-cadmium efflux system outer membrane protein